MSCQDDGLITDSSARLEFSTDTISFDTVFTTIGSVTDGFLIYNEFNDPIKIDKVELASGENSNFRMNLDGTEGSLFQEVIIDARDSMYVFVEVTVDQSEEALPFIIKDSIVFETNGNIQDIKLEAWGQNAVFHRNDTIFESETWIDTLPHVLYGAVVIPPDQTLTIDQGVNVYAHQGSVIFVEGALEINGATDSLVTFRGDRLDFPENIPAQWQGIFVVRTETQGGQATINNAVINNSIIGLNVGSSVCDFAVDGMGQVDLSVCFAEENKCTATVNNTVIKNTLLSGVSSIWSDITMENCAVHTCGSSALQLEVGGDYEFNHCTLATYGNLYITHIDPVVRAATYLNGLDLTPVPINLSMTNSIIIGSGQEELFLDPAFSDQVSFAVNFDHCLLKTEQELDPLVFIDCITNPAVMDTMFQDIFDQDYHLNDDSPAIDAGKADVSEFDLDGILRDASPDIGAYEFVP